MKKIIIFLSVFVFLCSQIEIVYSLALNSGFKNVDVSFPKHKKMKKMAKMATKLTDLPLDCLKEIIKYFDDIKDVLNTRLIREDLNHVIREKFDAGEKKYENIFEKLRKIGKKRCEKIEEDDIDVFIKSLDIYSKDLINYDLINNEINVFDLIMRLLEGATKLEPEVKSKKYIKLLKKLLDFINNNPNKEKIIKKIVYNQYNNEDGMWFIEQFDLFIHKTKMDKYENLLKDFFYAGLKYRYADEDDYESFVKQVDCFLYYFDFDMKCLSESLNRNGSSTVFVANLVECIEKEQDDNKKNKLVYNLKVLLEKEVGFIYDDIDDIVKIIRSGSIYYKLITTQKFITLLTDKKKDFKWYDYDIDNVFANCTFYYDGKEICPLIFISKHKFVAKEEHKTVYKRLIEKTDFDLIIENITYDQYEYENRYRMLNILAKHSKQQNLSILLETLETSLKNKKNIKKDLSESLFFGIGKYDVDRVETLLNNGANPNYSIERRKESIIIKLLDAGNIIVTKGALPKAMDILLKFGADVNYPKFNFSSGCYTYILESLWNRMDTLYHYDILETIKVVLKYKPNIEQNIEQMEKIKIIIRDKMLPLYKETLQYARVIESKENALERQEDVTPFLESIQLVEEYINSLNDILNSHYYKSDNNHEKTYNSICDTKSTLEDIQKMMEEYIENAAINSNA